VAIFSKSVSLLGLLLLDLKLLSFALAQVAYCLVLLGMYSYLDKPDFSVRTIKDAKGQSVSVLAEHKADLKEFALVSIVKFVLTEGEKFIIFAFRDFVTKSINNCLGPERTG
jgi:hypothetical protein